MEEVEEEEKGEVGGRRRRWKKDEGEEEEKKKKVKEEEDMKQVPYLTPTNIIRHRTKLKSPGELAFVGKLQKVLGPFGP